MKHFKQFSEDSIKGGKADKHTPESIAKKHGVSVDLIKKQIAMGIIIEREHTNDDAKAKEIAMDHLAEFPDYYTRLKKMEEGSREMKRFTQYNEEAGFRFFGAVDKVSSNNWYPEYGTKDRFSLRVVFLKNHGLVSFNPNLLHRSAIMRMYKEGKWGVEIGMTVPAGFARMVVGPKKEKEYLVNINHSYSVSEGWEEGTANATMMRSPQFDPNDKALLQRTAIAYASGVKVEITKNEVLVTTPEFLEMLAASMEKMA